MSKKQINFDLFNVKKNKSLKNRKGKKVSGNINIMSSLRKKIISELNRKSSLEEKNEKIQHKEKQQQQQQQHQQQQKNIKTLKSDFTESLNFLESNLHTDKKREQSNINKHKQSSLKKPMLNQINKHQDVNLELPSSLQEFNVPNPDSSTAIVTLNKPNNDIKKSVAHNTTKKQDPNYGCLKGGVKPTFKNKNVTIRNNNIKFNDNLESHVYIDSQEPVTNVIPANNNQLSPPPAVPQSYIKPPSQQLSYTSPHPAPSAPPSAPPYAPPSAPPYAPPSAPPAVVGTLPVPEISLPSFAMSSMSTNLSENKSSEKNKESNVEIPDKILDDISCKVGEKQLKNQNKPHVRFENKNRRNKTLKKIIVGKHNTKVSVLINDNKTRKKIKKEKQSLKLIPIKQVKDFLKEKGLIEIGSNAPEDVLRTLFENAKLSGEIENRNGEIFVNNFLDDKQNNTDEIGEQQ